MTWDKRVALVISCFPLVAFFIATVAELRAGGRVSTVVLRMIPPVIGINGFVMLWAIETSDTISRAMTVVSIGVACSGAFIGYSRRSSSIWVACGGLFLASLWMLNRPITDYAAFTSPGTSRVHSGTTPVGDATLVGNSTTPDSNRSSAITPSKA